MVHSIFHRNKNSAFWFWMRNIVWTISLDSGYIWSHTRIILNNTCGAEHKHGRVLDTCSCSSPLLLCSVFLLGWRSSFGDFFLKSYVHPTLIMCFSVRKGCVANFRITLSCVSYSSCFVFCPKHEQNKLSDHHILCHFFRYGLTQKGVGIITCIQKVCLPACFSWAHSIFHYSF